MTELPPLYRAAIATSLEDAGVERPGVSKDGQITEHPYTEEKRKPLYDPDRVFIVQAVVEADVMLGFLTGETLTRGKALLQAMGVEGWEVLYEKRREVAISHGISSASVRDTLTRTSAMIGAARRTIKPSSRT